MKMRYLYPGSNIQYLDMEPLFTRDNFLVLIFSLEFALAVKHARDGGPFEIKTKERYPLLDSWEDVGLFIIGACMHVLPKV